LVRQADFQRVADLRAAFGEATVVLSKDSADEIQLLVEDTQGFPRNRRWGE